MTTNRSQTSPLAETQTSAKVRGRFRMVASKVDGSGSRLLADFENMVLDAGFEHLFVSSTMYDRYFHVGASSDPVSPDQTRLGAVIAVEDRGTNNATGASVGLIGGSPFQIDRTRTARFAAGKATGNIAEVGVGPSDTQLFSRALVRGVDGEPTVVQVLPDEFLDLTYTFSVFVDMEDKPFTLNLISGVHDGVIRPAGLNDPNQFSASQYLRVPLTQPSISGAESNGSYITSRPLTDATQRPGGPTFSAIPSEERLPYVPGSLAREAIYTLPLEQATGLAPEGFPTWVITTESWLKYQIGFSPAIPKTAERIFRLRLRVSFERM